ncbi:DUF4038 domain-containing protein [Paenibacillus sacheonensis]|uniref:DUF4038 domain-containing protein n=1 Tax=Paenibacillus sacheonensis TaxID=742054 RepID=A0A7X4YS22_9BACL|nr:DUF4038 domain-containing protein [Paenibacillus sacheonensis]MBM7566861.1 hypothetical protein [Paenibacillus sacheonensis]NBC71483.1 DUF4038 domain-containing protein [Paenibacillus sacheonensis]
MTTVQSKQNQMVELTFDASIDYEDPFNHVKFEAFVSTPSGQTLKVPGFWAGGEQWKIRYASSQIGEHRVITKCSNHVDEGLDARSAVISIEAYEGDNPLFKHGAVHASANRSHLEHEDGTPFFWLADTWWMSLTDRLQWPDDFKWLTQDRVDKGYTAIQVVAGLYPDMGPFDERGTNEGGQSWEPGFQRLNPAFFEAADRKIDWMVQSGLMPCIVGSWGYYLDFLGKDKLRQHWEYLVARYGAYPVMWCAAGEANMPYYQSDSFKDAALKETYMLRHKVEWTEMGEFIKGIDPFRRALTIHPTEYGHDMVEDASMLDLDMLQTGHSGLLTVEATTKRIQSSVAREPKTPVINSEVCYEGIGGTSFQDTQRMLFWNCVLNGACGHTYGANGIWQVNDEERPYGASPTGIAWGHSFWKDAAKLPGSGQLGIGKRLLERYDWWAFRAHPEWLNPVPDNADVYARPYAAGIPGEVRVIYASIHMVFPGLTVRGIEPDVRYRAFLFDPATGEETDRGIVEPDAEGTWYTGPLPVFHDWVLVLERAK